MQLKEYLESPCSKLSIPYWKSKIISVPENMKIVHDNDFSEELFKCYDDEKYFRLIHYLNNINAEILDGFYVKTAALTDIPLIAETINKCYTDLTINNNQLYSYTETEVYNKNLWILVYEIETDIIVGCGIADFDAETKEGILEWIQVLPEYRGKGIGQLIVNQLLLRMKNADFVTVSGKMDNATNPEKLYRRCGFTGNDIWHVLKKK